MHSKPPALEGPVKNCQLFENKQTSSLLVVVRVKFGQEVEKSAGDKNKIGLVGRVGWRMGRVEWSERREETIS